MTKKLLVVKGVLLDDPCDGKAPLLVKDGCDVFESTGALEFGKLLEPEKKPACKGLETPGVVKGRLAEKGIDDEIELFPWVKVGWLDKLD